MSTPPPSRHASLHLFGVSGMGIGRSVTKMATDRFRLRSIPGLTFVKLLGTGDGRTFTPRDADPTLWGIFAVWESEADAAAFTTHSVVRGWSNFADEVWSCQLRPLKWKGEWSRQHPFGSARGSAGPEIEPSASASPFRVASLTRARIKPSQLKRFVAAVPPVAASALQAPGLQYAVGIGEAPIGLQATFSLWSSADAIDQFAYRQNAHKEVIRRTATDGWYSEEMFTRFAVVSTTGTVKGEII